VRALAVCLALLLVPAGAAGQTSDDPIDDLLREQQERINEWQAQGLEDRAAPGTGTQVLDEPDAAELAQSLAEAQAEQDICYGWDVNVSREGRDVGSSAGGPDVQLDRERCEKWVLLDASLSYACDSCDSSDTAFLIIASNLSDPPAEEDLKRLGYDADDLLGERDDQALFDMVQALPLLAAERGQAPPVPYEVASQVPAADRVTGSPGSDTLRDSWGLLVFCGALLLAGPLWFGYQRYRSKPTTTKE
jgi:hypothetical protein